MFQIPEGVKKRAMQEASTYATPAHGRTTEFHAAGHLAVLTVLAAHGFRVTLRETAVAAKVGPKATDMVLAAAAAINARPVVTTKGIALRKAG